MLSLCGCSPHTATPKSGTDTPQNERGTTAAASAPAPPDIPAPPTPKPLEAGRALEAGNLSRATRLAAALEDDNTASLLVKARVAQATGDFEAAVRYYHRMTDHSGALERMRLESLAEALAGSGRPEEAAGQLTVLLQTQAPIAKEREYALRMKQGEWLLEADAPTRAAAAFEAAAKLASTDKARDRANLARGSALLAVPDPKAARVVLAPLALNAAGGNLMSRAHHLLKENSLLPKWTSEQHLERAEKLIGYRAFDDAERTLDAARTAANKPTVDWLKARILFKKRRHYKEAHEALTAIASENGPYADEARFLAARALSRLDRDREAIAGYRAFAKKSPRRARANEARLLAGRLLFYLGDHRQALHAFEWLVGTGERPRSDRLADAGDRRDAHFLAGLSAILIERPKAAHPHLVAASAGTRHPEVLQRNRYWQAVARAMMDSDGWADDFRAICEADPTDWYALMSARRLEERAAPPGPCELKPPAFLAADGTTGGAPTPAVDIAALVALDPLAGLFAEAGLFKDAADRLRAIEREEAAPGPAETWIRNYMSLDAPHFAIKRAARAFDWPPTPETVEMARAAYPTPYADTMAAVTAEHSLPADLLYAIARKESLFDPFAVSWVGAMGMMQMMPRTYEANRKRAGLPALEPGALPGPIPSIRAAGHELAHLFKAFHGSLPLAIMAYNAGVAAVERWVSRSGEYPLDVFVEKVGFTQTRNYVRRVTQNLVRYRLLSGETFPGLPRTPMKPPRT